MVALELICNLTLIRHVRIYRDEVVWISQWIALGTRLVWLSVILVIRTQVLGLVLLHEMEVFKSHTVVNKLVQRKIMLRLL